MKLKQAIINNFRSIGEVEIDFTPTCRVLVGLNESGKSNILKALALLDKDRPLLPSDVRQPTADEPFVSEYGSCVKFVFALEGEDVERVHANAAARILANNENPQIAVIGGKQKTLRDLCARYDKGLYRAYLQEGVRDYSFWNLRGKLLPGWKAVADDCNVTVEVDGEERALQEYTLVRTKDFPNIPAEALKDADFTTLNNMIGTFVRGVVEENLPEMRFWEYSSRNILPEQVAIGEFAGDLDSCVPLKNMFTLAGCKNISEDLNRYHSEGDKHRMRNFLANVAKKTTAHFRSAWKEYRDVKFSLESDGGYIVPSIEEKTMRRFEDRSDGFKRFVTFLLLVSADAKIGKLRNTLLLVDEPEISLHPSGAEALRRELVNVARHNNVVYSTHSIFMVAPDDLGMHYIVTKDKNERTEVKKPEGADIKDEDVLYKALGFSVFHVFERQNVVFEGWRDKHLFKIATQRESRLTEKFKGIGLCHAKGVDNLSTIASVLELAKRDGVIISDADKAARVRQKKHKDDKRDMPWFTYHDINDGIEAETGEDFVRNSYLLEQIKIALDGDEHPALEELQLPEKKAKLAFIRTWLSKEVSDKDALNGMMDKIKDAVFGNLTLEHIDMVEYEKLLEGIAEKLSGGKE